jgi:hypothetical protein
MHEKKFKNRKRETDYTCLEWPASTPYGKIKIKTSTAYTDKK